MALLGIEGDTVRITGGINCACPEAAKVLVLIKIAKSLRRDGQSIFWHKERLEFIGGGSC